MQRHAIDVDAAVLRCITVTFDKRIEDLSVQQLNQLRLPTRYAGMQVDLPSHNGPLAFAAALVEHGPRLRAAILEWRPLAPGCLLPPGELDGTCAAERGGLLDELAARGVKLGACGKPARGSDDVTADPLRLSVPERHLFSQYIRASASAASDRGSLFNQ